MPTILDSMSRMLLRSFPGASPRELAHYLYTRLEPGFDRRDGSPVPGQPTEDECYRAVCREVVRQERKGGTKP